jgi:hypothetical protein
MPRFAIKLLGVAAALCAGVSCAGDAPPVDVDSTAIDVAESESMESEPLDTVTGAVAIVQQSQSRIGGMDLLGDPQSGSCTSEGDPLVATRYTYQGDWPTRTVCVEASDTTRRATLRMLDVQSTQRSAGYDETESVYVLFEADGSIRQGHRRYVSAETPPTREESGLQPADSALVRQLAQQVLDWCRRPSGAR